MEPITPNIPAALLPRRVRLIDIAAGQAEYRTLPSVVLVDRVISRWSFSPEERAAVARGEDLYLSIMTVGAILPVDLSVGPYDWSGLPQPLTVVDVDAGTHTVTLSCRHVLKQAEHLALPPRGAEVPSCPSCQEA